MIPRQACLGLIEARRADDGAHRRVERFRGKLASASLKRLVPASLLPHDAQIPRQACLGLIEARAPTGHTRGAAAIPRQACLGLIEAIGGSRSRDCPRGIPRQACLGLIEALIQLKRFESLDLDSEASLPRPH